MLKKELIEENNKLRKDIDTLINRPDSVDAITIKFQNHIEHSMINTVMFGMYPQNNTYQWTIVGRNGILNTEMIV